MKLPGHAARAAQNPTQYAQDLIDDRNEEYYYKKTEQDAFAAEAKIKSEREAFDQQKRDTPPPPPPCVVDSQELARHERGPSTSTLPAISRAYRVVAGIYRAGSQCLGN